MKRKKSMLMTNLENYIKLYLKLYKNYFEII